MKVHHWIRLIVILSAIDAANATKRGSSWCLLVVCFVVNFTVTYPSHFSAILFLPWLKEGLGVASSFWVASLFPLTLDRFCSFQFRRSAHQLEFPKFESVLFSGE
jgi:hypothetical protein